MGALPACADAGSRATRRRRGECRTSFRRVELAGRAATQRNAQPAQCETGNDRIGQFHHRYCRYRRVAKGRCRTAPLWFRRERRRAALRRRSRYGRCVWTRPHCFEGRRIRWTVQPVARERERRLHCVGGPRPWRGHANIGPSRLRCKIRAIHSLRLSWERTGWRRCADHGHQRRRAGESAHVFSSR